MTRTLDALLKEPGILVVPGAHDPLSARIAVRAGAAAVYMTGFGVAGAGFGVPDIGLVNAEQMIERVRVIAGSIAPVPLIADGDNGHGGPLNVARLVRAYEQAGAQCIQLEDQVSPKRCGHLDGKEVTSQEEFVSKIRAAVAARRNPDFLIIARTDARAVMGLDEAVKRANAALAAGADMAFVEATQTMEEVAAVPRLVNGPCLINVVPGGKTPLFNLSEAQEMGYRLAILPGILLKTVIEHSDATLQLLKETGMPVGPKSGANVADTFRRFGADEWNALRVKFQKQEEAGRG